MTVIRGTDGGVGHSCCSGSIRNVWGGQKPPGLGDSPGKMTYDNGGAPG